MMPKVHHHFATVDGKRLFYRDAGSPDRPALVLLHGFPTSSHMFRTLIPLLAENYHVIAPDHVGFGLSDAPPAAEFNYTFEALTDLTEGLLSQLGVDRYAVYVQDYGAPIGWRLVLRRPEAITAIITQNGNAYDAGFVPAFWNSVRHYWQQQTTETEAAVRQALTLDAIRWQYLTGTPDATLVDPGTWWHDYQLVSRPGNDAVQLKLFLDYATNPALYPQLHAYFRTSQIPLLATWGQGDEIFSPAGAHAFAADLPDAEIHLIDGGHFLLESAVDEVNALIQPFLSKHLTA